jgi:hypothetical protein
VNKDKRQKRDLHTLDIYKTLILVVFVFALPSCEMEGKRVQPCAGKYGSDSVIKKIERRYNLKDLYVGFAETYGDESILPKNCDTIHLVIGGSDIPYISADTFVVSIGRIFFKDPANKDVKILQINIKEDWRSVGRLTLNYLLNKEDYNSYDIFHPLIEAEQMEFTVESEHFYKDNEGEGLDVTANSQKDYRDYNKLALAVKGRYARVIKDKSLSHLRIDIRIVSPECKLCLNKAYIFFYDKRNKNM